MKSLLVFAHYEEAKFFLKELSFKKISSSFYEGTTSDLVILGEGIFQIFPTLAKILSEKNYSALYNLGTAGRTHEKIPLDEVFSIQTSYLFTTEAHYESFSLKGSKDCLTLFHRNDPPLGLAHLVDRELWAIAKLAKLYQKPLTSFKYVSDCLITQKEVFSLKKYSEKLFESFLSLQQEKDSFFLQLPENFYFTETQKRTYFKYYSYLKARNQISSLGPLLEKTYPGTKKEATKSLFQELEKKLFPLHEHLLSEENKKLQALNSSQIQFKTNLEDVNFHGKITSQDDLISLKKTFEELEQCFKEFF